MNLPPDERAALRLGPFLMAAGSSLLAILVAIFLIAWARVEVHGTEDLAALVEEHSTMSNTGTAENEAASSRWATGFSH